MALVMAFTWCENYGDERAHLPQSFLDAVDTIRKDRRILFLGLVQSLFEGWV
uniref:Transposase n=1 Tax=Globodera pallida TaxID=36090 RepID=A0A183CS52_GLOPA